MSAEERQLTVDDVRHKAEEIRDIAVSGAKRVVSEQGTKAALVGIVAMLAIASAAYYFGTRAACPRDPREL